MEARLIAIKTIKSLGYLVKKNADMLIGWFKSQLFSPKASVKLTEMTEGLFHCGLFFCVWLEIRN